MRAPDYIIKIAADSIAQLRRTDVERVLENCDDDELQPTADYITVSRPGLAAKVAQELDYQHDTRPVTSDRLLKS